jgi:hypothetical protein
LTGDKWQVWINLLYFNGGCFIWGTI